MRVATWNCQIRLDANWGVVEDLDVDVLTIQECGDGTETQARDRGWSCRWVPGGWEKGLAVLARPPYRIEKSESPEPFLVSAEMACDGARFRFVGFWAMTPSYAKLSYTRQGTQLVTWLPDDGVPTIVAGDFNASKSSPHLRNVAKLNERGLVSAYHHFHGKRHEDQEEHPTSYWRWDPERPFHMDFVFAPREWRVEAVEVGTYDDYLSRRRLSDHVPVVVTLQPK
jgi:endonuclease/exonuclease/phosphatase (EEP) superfamily protein YafD